MKSVLVRMVCAAMVGPLATGARGQCPEDTRSLFVQINGDFPAAMVVWPKGRTGPDDDVVVVGGSFSEAGHFSEGDVDAANVAQWDGNDWAAMGDGTDGIVRALGVYGGDIIAGGSFQNAGGMAASRIARWDGRDWHSLGDGLNGDVLSVAELNGDLIAAGRFTMSGDVAASRIARWDGSSWYPLGNGFDDDVRVINVDSGTLVAGGDFVMAGETVVNRVAEWDGAAWKALGAGADDDVNALAVFDGQLIVGGDFQSAGSVEVNTVAGWDGEEWFDLDGGMTGLAVPPAVISLVVFNGKLVAGGDFSSAGGVSSISAAVWEGSDWIAFGGNLDFDTIWHSVVPFGRDLLVRKFDAMSGIRWITAHESSTQLGDANGDAAVDLNDVAELSGCWDGPLGPSDAALVEKSCLCMFNSDGDSDVDLFDWSQIERLFQAK